MQEAKRHMRIMLLVFLKKYYFGQIGHLAGPILESKDMCAIFQKKDKKGKIFENLGKNVQNLKIF